MLTHKHRFHGHRSLSYVFRLGQTVRGSRMLLRIHKHPKRVHSRVAVVVSKKVAKKAVARNRIRRRIYETMRTNWEEVGAPYDIAFVVTSPEVGLVPAAEVREEIISLLRQGMLLHKQR